MSHYPLASDPRHVVTACPVCAKKGQPGDLRGPIDGKRSAQGLFTRAYFCRVCYWDQVLVMVDDVLMRERKEQQLAAQRAKRRGVRA
jgi:hypothetical protein